MKFQARFGEGENERRRRLEVLGDGRFADVSLDGEAGLFDVVTQGDGVYSVLAPGGRHLEVSVSKDVDGTVKVRFGAEVVAFELLDELTARALQTAGRRGRAAAADLKSSLPGRVLRIMVAVGDTVAVGQPLLVLEAMKMENEVRSVREGKIRTVDVAPGQAVGSGDVLIRFEA
ncbi:MAG TPA: biotin/lipoyl-containing protein [Thermoanaerobaculia bacterium]|nr:biotin/lipoyl-containing protein [Thermoanaerobaculia bacterium]